MEDEDIQSLMEDLLEYALLVLKQACRGNMLVRDVVRHVVREVVRHVVILSLPSSITLSFPLSVASSVTILNSTNLLSATKVSEFLTKPWAPEQL